MGLWKQIFRFFLLLLFTPALCIALCIHQRRHENHPNHSPELEKERRKRLAFDFLSEIALIYGIKVGTNDGPGLGNLVFVTINQFEKWVEFLYFLPNL